MSEREMWPGADKRKAAIRARLAAAKTDEGKNCLVVIDCKAGDGQCAAHIPAMTEHAADDLAYLLGEVERLERWKADAIKAINDAMAGIEWDCIPADQCGDTWAYVAELQRLIGSPLAIKQAKGGRDE